MTLLAAFRSSECIVVAHDLKGSNQFRYDETTHKFATLDHGVLALWAGDAGVATAILQAVSCEAGPAPTNLADALGPHEWSRRIQKEAFGRYSVSCGEDYTKWTERGAIEIAFLVVGFDGAHGPHPVPVINTLYPEDGFQPKSPSLSPVLAGDSGVANYLLAGMNTMVMAERELRVLAALLIHETSLVSNTVSRISNLYTVRPRGVIERMSAEGLAAVHEAAEAASDGLRNAIREAVRVCANPPRKPPTP